MDAEADVDAEATAADLPASRSARPVWLTRIQSFGDRAWQRLATARVLGTVAPYLAAALVALGAALWTYRPWAFGSAFPVPHGDALAFYSWIQNIVETGWYEYGPRLSAPFGQNSHTYLDNSELTYFLVGRVLAPLAGSTAQGVIWAVVLSFPAAAVTAVFLARWLAVGRVPAFLVGTLFAVLPDHFLRASNGHYGLSQTWVIPLGVLAAVSLLHAPPPGRSRRVRETLIVVACLVVALVNAYYAVFAGILVAGAGILAWRRDGLKAVWWRVVIRGAALAGPIGLTTYLDSLWARQPMGFASMAITRSQSDADLYAGKIVGMLMPSSLHHDARFRSIRERYEGIFPFPAEGPALGLVASVAFVVLVIWAVLVYAKPKMAMTAPVVGTLAGLTWLALFTYVVGGLGQLWAIVMDGGGLRVWSRMHLFIGLLALLAAGYALSRIRRRTWRTAAVVALVLIGLWDTTSPLYRPDPVAAKAVQAEVSDLTTAIAEQVPPDAMIYQYPAVSFPVPLRDDGALKYAGFLPYLYSEDLRWTYGGLQGDPTADWQESLQSRPPAQQMVMLQASGFAGVLVNTGALAAYPDELAEVRQALGTPDTVSSSGRWEFYRLDPPSGDCADAAAELADATLKPVIVYPGTGFEPRGVTYTTTTSDPSQLRLVTLRDSGWARATVTFTIDVPAGGIRLTWPDGTDQSLDGGRHDVTWTGQVASESIVDVTRNAPDGGPVVVTEASTEPGLSQTALGCLGTADPSPVTN